MTYLLLQTFDEFCKWLESEQSDISHYFNRHPPARRSFLEAVQRVADRGSLVTPAATPAESALDNSLPNPVPRRLLIGQVH